MNVVPLRTFEAFPEVDLYASYSNLKSRHHPRQFEILTLRYRRAGQLSLQVKFGWHLFTLTVKYPQLYRNFKDTYSTVPAKGVMILWGP